MAHIICGVDIGAETLDARIGRDGAWQQFVRTNDSIDRLAAFCRTHQAGLVVMEATGGYERLPFHRLWAAEIPVAIVNPRSVRQFAEAMGTLEKTDKIDAGMIASYGETKRIVPTPPPSDDQRALTALVRRLRQLIELRTAQNNQRRLVDQAVALDSFTTILAMINREIRSLQTRIIALIDADPLWCAFDQAFREVKGVADRTIACLMANLPEIGTLSGKAIAKLAGLAPIARDSGKKNGNRPVRGGARLCDPSFMWSPRSSAATIPTSRRFIRRCALPKGRQGRPHRSGPQAAGPAERQGPVRKELAQSA